MSAHGAPVTDDVTASKVLPRHRAASAPAVHHRLRAGYLRRPVAVAGVLFGALAVLRICGAFSQELMVASIVLTPALLLAAPRSVWPDIGVRRINSSMNLVHGVAVVIAAYAIVLVACLVAFGTGPDNWMLGIKTLFLQMAGGSTVLAVLVAVLCMGVLVPIAEEVCFRGVLHHAARSRLTVTAAVVGTSAIWAAVHLGDYGLNPFNGLVIVGVLPSVFIMGLALGWCRVITGSVAGSTIAQGIANLLLVAWVFTI